MITSKPAMTPFENWFNEYYGRYQHVIWKNRKTDEDTKIRLGTKLAEWSDYYEWQEENMKKSKGS